MGWSAWVLALVTLHYAVLAAGMPHTFELPQRPDDEDVPQEISISEGEQDSVPRLDYYEDVRLQHLGKMLANVLIQPWPKGTSPILYVEDYPSNEISDLKEPANGLLEEETSMTNTPYKRSRYYRKYPWKRQNSRYEPENRYLCQPSKEDVFRLLVALHEARQGNRGQTVNFCNRKRPASAVFTNIRFLG